MLVIRLFRVGKKNQPSFKIIITDKKNPPRGGRFLEVLGHYSPKLKKQSFKEERIKYWMEKGAKPSDTCHNLLVRAGIIKDKKIKIKISLKKKKEKKVRAKKEEKGPKTTSELKPEEKTEKKSGEKTEENKDTKDTETPEAKK